MRIDDCPYFRYLLTGVSMTVLSSEFLISRSVITNIIPKMCELLWSSMKTEAFPPMTRERFEAIAQGFADRGKLPHTIGCLDGKHIECYAFANSGSKYFNYKKTFSVVLMAACDAMNAFTFVDIGAPGSDSDGGVFRRCQLGVKLFDGSLDIPPPQKLPGNFATQKT